MDNNEIEILEELAEMLADALVGMVLEWHWLIGISEPGLITDDAYKMLDGKYEDAVSALKEADMIGVYHMEDEI